MKKFFLTMLLAFTMLFSLSVSAHAADVVASGECGSSATWTLDSEGTLTITGTGGIERAPWSEEGAADYGPIKRVTIERGITSICAEAFYSCNELTEVQLPDGLRSIGEKAFRSKDLTVNLPSTLTDYRDAFSAYNKGVIKNLYVDDLKWLLDSMLTNGVGELEFTTQYRGSTYHHPVFSFENLYVNGALVTDLVIPQGVETIPDYAFDFCASITSVTLPDSVKVIGNGAFSECDALQNVDLGEGLRLIGRRAFFESRELTSIDIPASVKRIAYGAFGDESPFTCLERINFYGDAPILDNNVFDGASPKAYYDNRNKGWSEVAGKYYGGSPEWRLAYLAAVSDAERASILGYGAMGKNAIWILHKDGLLEVLGTGLVSSYDSTGAESWSAPGDSLKASIKKIVYGSGVTRINVYFEKCAALKSVSFSKTVLNTGVYNNSKKLETVQFASGSRCESVDLNAFMECNALTSIDLPDTVKSIGSYAFCNTGLTSIDLPDQLEIIRSESFSGTGVRQCVIPASVVEIEDGAFASIKKGDNAVTYAFYGEAPFTELDADRTIFSAVGGSVEVKYIPSERWNAIAVPGNFGVDIWTPFNGEAHAFCTEGQPVAADRVDPGCGSAGEQTYHISCIECGKLLRTTTEELAPTGNHTPGEAVDEYLTEDWEPDCINDGSYDSVVYCTECKQEISRKTVVIPALGHTPGEPVEEIIPPTCGAAGERQIVVSCTVCERELERNTAEIPPTEAHSPQDAVEENRVEATCAKVGSYDSVVYCAECGQEVSRETKEIPLSDEHTPDSAKEAVGKKPTCESEGYNLITVECAVCGTKIAEEKIVVPALPHSPGKVRQNTCLQPTCKTVGSAVEKNYCTECDALLSTRAVELPKTNDHDFAGHTVITRATTLGSPGTYKKTLTCTVCGKTSTESGSTAVSEDNRNTQKATAQVIEPHCVVQDACARYTMRMDPVEIIVDTDYYKFTLTTRSKVTCTMLAPEGIWPCGCEGLWGYIWNYAGNVKHAEIKFVGYYDGYARFEAGAELAAGDYLLWINPTVDKCHGRYGNGYLEDKSVDYDLYYFCEPVNGGSSHSHQYKTAETVSATCTSGGYTVMRCSCGDEYQKDVVAAMDHAWDSGKVIQEATEEREGVKEYHCTNCKAVHVTAIPVGTHEHDYASEITEATCTEGGYTTYTCFCGDSYTDKPTEALGHDWDEGKVTKQPTEEAEGEKTFTCSRCEETKTEPIDKLAHTHKYVEKVTDATCTAEGYTTYTCACGESYTDNRTEALNHDWDDGKVTKEPTANAEGEKTYTCSRCEETKTEPIPALNHTHKYSEQLTAATCTQEGYTTYTCDCGESYTDKRTEALGHDWDEGKVTKKPTETAEGEKTFTCSRCKETKTESIEKLKPLPAVLPFTDVDAGAYYYTPVRWAMANNITQGTSATTFDPEQNCTRGQVVTFLWRAKGSPEPESTQNPFTDVASNAYYYKAVLWAVEKGITTGTSATTFGPEQNCTRGQVVTFLHRAAGEPAASGSNVFGDVKSDAYYYNAVLWAVGKGVTSGTSATTFEPDKNCSRGQIVTFLYRADDSNPPVPPVTPVKYYTVTFADYNGYAQSTQSVPENGAATPPEPLYREGYKFVGWSHSYDRVTSDMWITPIYEQTVKYYTVTFADYNGYAQSTQSVPEYGTATPPEPIWRDGYKFIGWSHSYDRVTSDMWITPIYEKEIKYYTVTFADYNGYAQSTQSVPENGAATPPEPLYREGYKFVGWSHSFDCVTSDMWITPIYEQISRGEAAFNALSNWIINKHTEIDEGKYCFVFSPNTDDGVEQYTLRYGPGDSFIDVIYTTMDSDGATGALLELTYDKAADYAGVVLYTKAYGGLKQIFEGSAMIRKSSFSMDSTIRFNDYSGFYAEGTCENLLKYATLRSLMYVDFIFQTYIPQYSVADFGYKSIYN